METANDLMEFVDAFFVPITTSGDTTPADAAYMGPRNQSGGAVQIEAKAPMTAVKMNGTKLDFLIIGAQKAGTTWLWSMLEQHPGTDLPRTKEIHFFGSAELYQNGREWYYSHFAGLDQSRIIGEASTTYFYDYVPYWYNPSDELQTDHSLPSIPDLITRELPHVKILVILRDPVRRAVSAYYHYVRAGTISPSVRLKETAVKGPKLRIVEYGYYAKYIKLWREFVPPDRLRILVFEEDVRKTPESTLRNMYEFLNLDPEFKVTQVSKPVHKSWGWTRLLLAYYADPLSRRLLRSRVGNVLARFSSLPGAC